MSVSLYYANFTKKQWFYTAALGGSGNWRGLGRTPTARGFELLMLGPPTPLDTSPQVTRGSWAGNSVGIIGDTSPQWDECYVSFTDIEADVIVMVHHTDGFDEIGEAAEDDTSLFMELCYLVATRQALELEPGLHKHFGANYLKRYKDLCQGRNYMRPKDLILHQNPEPPAGAE